MLISNHNYQIYIFPFVTRNHHIFLHIILIYTRKRLMLSMFFSMYVVHAVIHLVSPNTSINHLKQFQNGMKRQLKQQRDIFFLYANTYILSSQKLSCVTTAFWMKFNSVRHHWSWFYIRIEESKIFTTNKIGKNFSFVVTVEWKNK